MLVLAAVVGAVVECCGTASGPRKPSAAACDEVEPVETLFEEEDGDTFDANEVGGCVLPESDAVPEPDGCCCC